MALTRKTYNFTERAMESMGRLIEADGYNETDTVNRALNLAAMLLEYRDSNEMITVIDPDTGEKVRIFTL